ncbi:hypothetical protein BT93_L0405 [Corymbia citriodora subsp. variegata]|uniref:Serine carboxypeptidase-like 18 n=1 Tax=Corymbia citriodora subsp. variegata TaxID=360336 RepID=A0A8T0CUL2_CORYI|nr:hypothetical protein BT93_L0405 [Corymbia citriodora subsp. variegata]KAF7849677.1 hypothetical protein BT93_L0405 [Corymbia citriodora subsp. variegata]
MKWLLAFLGLALCLLSRSTFSQTVIKTLPGFPGELPFYLEIGYVGVGELEDVQMFYYFIKSERSPKDDPLVLWITGGPGCSTLSAILYEIGPLTFNYENLSPSRPTLKVHEYSWTKVANIIFVDEPVGTGFSYANNWESYNWLTLHPEFLSNPLYIGGDSNGGFINPMVTLKVAEGNKAGLRPIMNLKGYLLGNPVTNLQSDKNSRVRFAYLKALISKELYESTDENCNGDFINVNESNDACIDDLKAVTMCLEKLDIANILEPNCLYSTPESTVDGTWDPSLVNRDPTLLPSPELPGIWCRVYNYMLSYTWANDRAVQEALHVRPGTIMKWVRCNESLSYKYNVREVIDYHKELLKRGYRALIYRRGLSMAKLQDTPRYILPEKPILHMQPSRKEDTQLQSTSPKNVSP